MTTTAFDDQFTSTQTIKSVHAPYEPIAILKRNVPELDDKALREEMTAAIMLATDADGVTDGEIALRGFAKRVLMTWGTQEGMYLAFRDAVTAPVPAEWREAMQEAHDTFQRYADLHRAKDTRDGHEKAKLNQKLANKLYALLQSTGATK